MGEALVDVLTGDQGELRPTPGGSPANVALGLARLGRPVRLATRTGDDTYGALVRDHLTRDGVLLVDGATDANPTATATVTFRQNGSARYDFALHWQLSTATTAALHGGTGYAHLHTGSLATALAPGAAQVLAAVRAARPWATVSYDPNLRPTLLDGPEVERPRVEALVDLADLVKASEEDLDWLYPDLGAARAAADWAQRGPSLVVLTRGDAGATAFWPHGSYEVPAVPVDVADTVGAGDAFMSGLLHGLLAAGLLGGDGTRDQVPGRAALRAATRSAQTPDRVPTALRLAALAAAVTCGRPGADPPTAAELRSLAEPDGRRLARNATAPPVSWEDGR
ncbi:carbohydrate kinase [Streptacidiphilus pinicola]|uniref:Carbohydrate kinase n=2 Tax=Streptacidiphilus pinicola TaxID=2219663 RepID=A0A2X0J6T3_9ACTN|nr:carbohydrate kinase [Streptacidiphilus pinicola]